MSQPPAASVRAPRVNPFAFPSETTLRFGLLVIFVLCGTAALYGALQIMSREATTCASQLGSGILMQRLEPSGDGRDAAARGEALLPVIAHCIDAMSSDAVLRVAGIGLVAGVAVLLYFLHPGRMQRRRRLEPLGTSGLGDLELELQRLVKSAGLEPAPTFLWNPLASGLPIVFGRRGRYCVALSGAFVAQYFYRDRDGFRAVILHELAHIRNGDVGKTYFTWALWQAFVAVGLAPAVVFFLWRLAQGRWSDATALLSTGVLWTAVIVLSGLAVLRAREYYADVRASAWGEKSRIDDMLAVLAAPAGGGWRRWLRFHPDPQQRRDIVKDPAALLRLGFADVLGIGIATWSVIAVVSNLLIYLLPLEPTLVFVYFAGIKLVVPGVVFILGVGAVGIGVWRTAFSAELRDERPAKGTGWLAVAFVAGGLPGVASMAVEAFLRSIEPSPMPLGVILLFLQVDVAVYIVLLAGCLVIFPWISQAASAWFDVVVRSRSPQPLLLLSVAMALLLIVGVFGLATFAVLFAVMVQFDGGDEVSLYTYLLMAAPILVASLATWVFPFAASWWSRRKVHADGGQRAGDQTAAPAPVAGWVFLDGATPWIAERAAPRLWAALSVGLYAGLFFWAFWELYYYRQFLPAAIGRSMTAAFDTLYAWSADLFGSHATLLPASAAFFEILAAAIVAARAPRLAELSGLFAAFVAGAVISAGNIVFFIELGSTLADRIRTIVILMGPGTLIAIGASIVAGWAGRGLRPTAYTAPVNSGGRWQSRVSNAGLLILALLVATGMGVRLFHSNA